MWETAPHYKIHKFIDTNCGILEGKSRVEEYFTGKNKVLAKVEMPKKYDLNSCFPKHYLRNHIRHHLELMRSVNLRTPLQTTDAESGFQ